MSRHVPEILLRSQFFKSAEEYHYFKRIWETCEPMKDTIQKHLQIKSRKEVAIGFYPTTQNVGIVVLGTNNTILDAKCLSSSYSLFSDSTRFSVDLSTQLCHFLSSYYNKTLSPKESIPLLYQPLPPILGVNSERVNNVLLYSEFIGLLKYETYHQIGDWPIPINLSNIAKEMKMKLYTIQHESENAFQLSSFPLSSENNNVSSIITAHSIVQYGFYHFIAKQVLSDFNILESPSTSQIDNIKERDMLVKAFIAGNTRILQKYDSISISSILYQDYSFFYTHLLGKVMSVIKQQKTS